MLVQKEIIQKEIINLIIAQDENDQVDFKGEYYSKDKKYDLIKDIVSFANNTQPYNKYIVFGIENSSWKTIGIDALSLPDVSEINDLLRTYVEPFINVLLGCFSYKNVTIGYIMIPYNDLNRPYVISKEYNKNKLVSLRKGEVYIRKGASNFICSRNDLDNIYNNRGSVDISFHETEIKCSNIRINGISNLMGQVRFLIQNNTPKTIIINDIRLLINCETNLLEHKIDFIDDTKSVFNRMPELLSCVPIQLSSGDCIQKTAFFSISETAAVNLRKKASSCSMNASLQLYDALKRVYQNSSTPIHLQFADDLLKKWSC